MASTGFDVDPRIAVRFDRPIDVARISRRTLYLQRIGRASRIGGQPDRLRLADARALGPRDAAAPRPHALPLDRRPPGPAREHDLHDDGSDEPDPRDACGHGSPAAAAARHAPLPASRIRGLRARIDTGSGFAEAGIPDLARAGGGTYAFGSLAARQWLRPDRTIRPWARAARPRCAQRSSSRSR
jgi:hypothetical protein